MTNPNRCGRPFVCSSPCFLHCLPTPLPHMRIDMALRTDNGPTLLALKTRLKVSKPLQNLDVLFHRQAKALRQRSSLAVPTLEIRSSCGDA